MVYITLPAFGTNHAPIHKFLTLVTYNLQSLNLKGRPTNLQPFHFHSPKKTKSTAYRICKNMQSSLYINSYH